MEWDDEYDSGYDDISHASHRDNSMPDTDDSAGGLDFKDISDPISAYLFLSDDARMRSAGRKRRT